MKQIAFLYCMLVLLLSLAGCGRYVCWVKDVFDQGDKLETFSCEVEGYIRSARVYDQFDTLGLFDALWLNHVVRHAYVDSYSLKHCLSDAAYQALLNQELEQTENFISFYVLASVPGQFNTLLTDLNSLWTVRLEIDGQCYEPVKLKIVDLTHEYQKFFGPRFTIFKTAYLVAFDARDKSGAPLLSPLTECFALVFRRVGRETRLIWNMDEAEAECYVNELDKDILSYDIDTNI
jgi:hypothetical protein